MNRHKNESIAIDLNALTKVHRYTLHVLVISSVCLGIHVQRIMKSIFFIPYLILINLTQLILSQKM